jgi:hypothetical protein
MREAAPTRAPTTTGKGVKSAPWLVFNEDKTGAAAAAAGKKINRGAPAVDNSQWYANAGGASLPPNEPSSTSASASPPPKPPPWATDEQMTTTPNLPRDTTSALEATVGTATRATTVLLHAVIDVSLIVPNFQVNSNYRATTTESFSVHNSLLCADVSSLCSRCARTNLSYEGGDANPNAAPNPNTLLTTRTETGWTAASTFRP